MIVESKSQGRYQVLGQFLLNGGTLRYMSALIMVVSKIVHAALGHGA